MAREFSDGMVEDEVLVGQVIISEESLLSRTLRRDHSHDEEFVFLVAHGLLHTLGYDHGDEEQASEMEGHQEELLRAVIDAATEEPRGDEAS